MLYINDLSLLHESILTFINGLNLPEAPVDFTWYEQASTINKGYGKYAAMSIIYGWLNTVNGKVYAGSAADGSDRPFFHLSGSKKVNPHFRNALALYGRKNFLLLTLRVVGPRALVSKPELQKNEQVYLDCIPKSLKYNIAEQANSPAPLTHTPESRALISAAGLGRLHDGLKMQEMSDNAMGRGVSEATKQKLIRSSTGVKQSAETLALKAAHKDGIKTIVTNMDTGISTSFATRQKAAQFIGCADKTVKKASASGRVLTSINGSFSVKVV